jgi:carbon monoxide dehydrogenase subunit G
MKIQGEYTFDGPREAVWEVVRDPEVLATALPGTQSLEQVSDNEYQGEMHVRIGPIAGLFSGQIVISDEVPPESLTMTVEGKGKPGFVKGTGSVRLTSQEDSLNQAVIAREGATSSGEEVQYQAPSETEFAASVARDMAGQVFTPSRLIWIALAILIIIIVVVILTR